MSEAMLEVSDILEGLLLPCLALLGGAGGGGAVGLVGRAVAMLAGRPLAFTTDLGGMALASALGVFSLSRRSLGVLARSAKSGFGLADSSLDLRGKSLGFKGKSLGFKGNSLGFKGSSLGLAGRGFETRGFTDRSLRVKSLTLAPPPAAGESADEGGGGG